MRRNFDRPMRLAIFDLDGTVLRCNSWRVYFWWAIRRWPKAAPALLMLLTLRRLRLIGARTLREAALRMLKGLGAEEVMAIGTMLVEEKLRRQVRPAARAEIARCRTEGFELVLATGAFDFVAERLAIELGIRVVVCSRLEFAGASCLGRIAGEETRGKAKAAAVRARFEGRSVEWENSRAYSDDVEDVPLWALVGHPVFVVRAADRSSPLPPDVKVTEWPDE